RTAFIPISSVRGNGPPADPAAPSIHFLNMSLGTTTDQVAAIAEATAHADALVVDMRGYPSADHYRVAQGLIPAAFKSAVFNLPTWTGPDALTIDREQ